MNPTRLDNIDDPMSLLATPGHYYTTTGQQAYLVVKALSWHPKLHLGEELFFPEGSTLYFQVDGPSLASNPPTVDWGTASDYYERRLDSYAQWEMAWWREVVQNARDARATRIDLVCEESGFVDPDTGATVPAMRVSCYDNGSGMDEDTLRRAFFTRGGSMKEAGAVGGFGDAKELILSPWLGYEVHTRDLVAKGRHESLYVPGITGGQQFVQGTRVTVWMPLHRTTSADYARALIERCNLPGVTVTVNGKREAAGLIGGTKVLTKVVQDSRTREEIGSFEVYHQKRSQRHGVYVRGNGVYMFEIEFDGDYKGVVYIDIVAPARKVFTRKRDQLSYDSTARADIMSFLQRLAVDPKSELKKERAERNKMRKVIRGTGSMEVHDGIAAELAAKIAAKAPFADMKEDKKKRKPIAMSVDFVAVVEQSVKEAIADRPADYAASKEAPSVDLSPLPAAIGAMMSQVEFFETEQVAGALQLAAWKPDLYVYQNLDNYKVPKRLDPATMAPKYVRLLRLWAELVRYALIQLGMFKRFGVGWVFDTEMEGDGEMVIGAAHTKDQGTDWLLLNPINLKHKRGSDPSEYDEEGDRYDLSNERDLEGLCASVIHEVTHMQGFGRHDQAYAYALTQNIRIAFGMKAAAKKILKAVNAAVREEVSARREVEEKVAEVPWLTVVGRVAALLQAWDGISWQAQKDVAEDPAGLAARMVRPGMRGMPHDIEMAIAEIRGKAYTSGGAPMRSEWPSFMKPKLVLAFYDSFVKLARAQGMEMENLFSPSVPDWTRDAEVMADLSRQVWGDKIPADPRATVEAPPGVYTWVKQGDEFILRAGYGGQRGEAIVRQKKDGSSQYARENAGSPTIADRWRQMPSDTRHRWDDLLIFNVTDTGKTWTLRPPVLVGPTSSGATNEVHVEIKQDAEEAYVFSYAAGPRNRGFATVADAQAYVVDWVKKNAQVARERAGYGIERALVKWKTYHGARGIEYHGYVDDGQRYSVFREFADPVDAPGTWVASDDRELRRIDSGLVSPTAGQRAAEAYERARIARAS